MLEHTLGGLSALLRHERIQNELQLAGGTAAFLHHLQTLKCQDPSESLLRVTWGSIVNYLPIYGILGTDLYTNPVEPENKLSLYFCLTREALIPLSYKMRIIQAIDPQDLAKSDPGSFIAGVVDGLHEMLTSRDMGQKAEAAKYVSGLWKKPHLSTKFAGTLEVMLDHLLRYVIASPLTWRSLHSENSAPVLQILIPLPTLMSRLRKPFSIRCWSYSKQTSTKTG